MKSILYFTVFFIDYTFTAFDVNTYVTLIGTIANYNGLKDCWLCGEVQQWNLPLIGVPTSNWSDLNPYSLHSASSQCTQAGSSLGKLLFQLQPINESVTYIGLKDSGTNLSNFSGNTAGWVNVTQAMWKKYLFDRHTRNESLRINTSCYLPDGSWWLCGNGIALKQLPGNWTGQCTMAYLIPQLGVINQTNEITGVIEGQWKNRLTKRAPKNPLMSYSTRTRAT